MALLKKVGEDRTTHRLEFDDGDWVELYEERLYADTMRAQDLARQRTAAKQGNRQARRRGVVDVQIGFDPAEFNIAMVEVMLVAWSAPEEITPENIARLPQETFDEIRDYLDRNYIEDEDEGKSGKTSNSPSAQQEASNPETLTMPSGQND